MSSGSGSTNDSEAMMREWIKHQLETRKIMKNTGDDVITEYVGSGWEVTARRFGTSYVIFGILAIMVNIVIFTCIILRRRTTFSHVFYLIILNFTIIDTIKGICSILFALKLLTSNMSIDASTWTVRVDQYSGVLLRLTNLTTIMNVLLITMNEFIFICNPLRYATIVTRKRILWAIVLSWILASFLTLLNMLTNVKHRSVMIDTDCGNGDQIGIPFCIRHQTTPLTHYLIFHLSLIAFCLICLGFTASCYVILFRIIKKMVKQDEKYQAEVDLLKDEPAHPHKSIVRRKKYVIMIGSVIIVYSIYLGTYAVIQGMHIVNITRRSDGSLHMNSDYIYTKYICYLFISFHSLLQPLCFMRMREFRNILKRTICPCTKRETILSTDLFKRQSCQPTDI